MSANEQFEPLPDYSSAIIKETEAQFGMFKKQFEKEREEQKKAIKHLDRIREDKEWTARNQELIASLQDLAKSGIFVTEEWPKLIPHEKLKDPNFISAIKFFHKLGFDVNIYNLQDVAREGGWDEFEKRMKSEDYVKNVKSLKKSGIDLSGGLIPINFEKGTHQEFIDTLMSFNKNGMNALSLVSAFPVEQIGNKRYFEGLMDLANAKIEITPSLLANFTEQMIDWIPFLIQLHQQKEINIDGGPLKVLERAKKADESYFAILKKTLFQKKTIGDAEVLAKRQYLKEQLGWSDPEMEKLYSSNDAEAITKMLEAKKKPLSRYAEKILNNLFSDLALKTIRKINDLHEGTLDARMAVIENYSPEALYQLVVSGGGEVFTSSFKKVLAPQILKKIKEQNWDALDWCQKSDPKKQGRQKILEIFSRFNEIDALFSTLRGEERLKQFLKESMGGIGTGEEGIENATALSDVFESLKDPKIIEEIEKDLKMLYEKAKGEEKVLYGLVGSLHGGGAKSEKGFFEALIKEYPSPRPDKIEIKELLNRDREVIQQYFFYNDEDGISSFKNTISHYKSMKSWEIEERTNHVEISYKNPISNIKIIKFLNKPNANEAGFEDVEKAMSTKDLSAIEIIHRGHSYHAQETIQKISDKAKIVFLGSCGGFDNVSSTLSKAPKAHILSTKGEGTKVVNEPLLGMIDEYILNNQKIVWNDFWLDASSKIKDTRFNDYISPSQNKAMIIYNAMHRLMPQDKN